MKLRSISATASTTADRTTRPNIPLLSELAWHSSAVEVSMADCSQSRDNCSARVNECSHRDRLLKLLQQVTISMMEGLVLLLRSPDNTSFFRRRCLIASLQSREAFGDIFVFQLIIWKRKSFIDLSPA